MPLHRSRTDEQPRCDLVIPEPSAHQLQNVDFAIAQSWQRRLRYEPRRAKEGMDLSEEVWPSRLIGQEDVIDRFEG
jgi:hypothetical protein